jgi:hypothetical protein
LRQSFVLMKEANANAAALSRAGRRTLGSELG